MLFPPVVHYLSPMANLLLLFIVVPAVELILLIKLGSMIGIVATIAVILWTNWVNFLVTARPQPHLEPDDLAEGALHGFLAFAPYLTEQFVEEVRAAIRSWAMLHDGADLVAK